MKKITPILSSIAMLIMAASCSKQSGTNLAPLAAKDVYVAWYSRPDLPGDKTIAEFTKNSTLIPLGDGIIATLANAIAVSGKDVYIAGYQSKDDTNTIARYWKNGTAYDLSDGSNVCVARGVAIAGNDVYIAGNEALHLGANPRHVVPEFWKNGIKTFLPSGDANDANATGIALSGNDIYICGNETYSGVGFLAKYWKNGVAVALTDSTHPAYASAIAVSGNDVYVVGYWSDGDMSTACYWKNGTRVDLTDANTRSLSWSIALSGADVYVAGITTNSSHFNVPTYWKNGVPVELNDGQRAAGANAIAVSGNDVYVAGYEWNGSIFVGKYWKNGVAVIHSEEISAITTGICVN
jgi:hypothetical protein